MAEPDPKHTGWRKLLLKNLWAVIIAPIVVGLAIAWINGDFKGLTSKEPGPAIEALEPVVRNGARDHEIIDIPNSDFIGSRQTDRSRARVEVRLRNTGERRTVITDAVVTIRKLIAVPPCGLGGGSRFRTPTMSSCRGMLLMETAWNSRSTSRSRRMG